MTPSKSRRDPEQIPYIVEIWNPNSKIWVYVDQFMTEAQALANATQSSQIFELKYRAHAR